MWIPFCISVSTDHPLRITPPTPSQISNDYSRSQQKLMIFHRINGYMVLLLLTGGVTGALIITRHAFGGDISTQTASVTLSVATTVSAILAYYNIKRLQIDQHRKWMLRTIFYMASIITVRIIMGIGMAIIATIGTYGTVSTPYPLTP